MLSIRELLPGEYGAAGEVTTAGFREFYGDSLGSYGERLRDIAARAAGAVVLVAVEGDEIVGTVTYVPDASSEFAEFVKGDEASIRMLSVAPHRKRAGIGRALSVECIERARADGKRAVMLHADEIMPASRHLYESLGFRRDPSRDYRPDEETFLVCYVLDL